MQILDLVGTAQGGALIGRLAIAAGVDAPTMHAALARLCPLIARRIAERAADPEDYETLLEELEAGEADTYLDSPRALMSRAAVRDGEGILTHLYGSLEAARRQARRVGAPQGMAEATFERLMSFAAVLVLAAMTRRGKALALPAAGEANIGGGLVALLLDAIVKGIVDGARQAFLPRRRRASISLGRKTRKRTRRRPRTRTPSLEDLLGDLLKPAGDKPPARGR